MACATPSRVVYFFVGMAFAAVLMLVAKAVCTLLPYECHGRLRALLVAVGLVKSCEARRLELQLRAPSTSYRRNEEEGLAGECSICLSAFVEGEEVRRLPECGHVYHVRCIDVWLLMHDNCPLCRAAVLANSQ